MGLAHGLLRALQLAFFTIVLGIAAFMVSRNDQFHKHDHLASYLTTTGVVSEYSTHRPFLTLT